MSAAAAISSVLATYSFFSHTSPANLLSGAWAPALSASIVSQIIYPHIQQRIQVGKSILGISIFTIFLCHLFLIIILAFYSGTLYGAFGYVLLALIFGFYITFPLGLFAIGLTFNKVGTYLKSLLHNKMFVATLIIAFTLLCITIYYS